MVASEINVNKSSHVLIQTGTVFAWPAATGARGAWHSAKTRLVEFARSLQIAGHDVVSIAGSQPALRLSWQGGFDVMILGLILLLKDGLTDSEELGDSGVTTPVVMAAASQHLCREANLARSAALLQLGRKTELPLACDGRKLYYVVPDSGPSGCRDPRARRGLIAALPWLSLSGTSFT